MNALYFMQETVRTRTISLIDLRTLYFEKNTDINEKDAANTYRAFDYLFEKFPDITTETFDADCLEVFQKHLISKGYSWGYCQKLVKFIRTVFNWGVRRKLISPSLAYELKLVPAIKHGVTRESVKRQNVPRQIIETALPFLPSVIADMVQMQLLTGMRPSEVCRMTPAEVDKSLFPDRWVYEPAKHKNTWRGKKRTIWLGQSAKEIIERNNNNIPDKPVFSNRRGDFFTVDIYSKNLRNSLKTNRLPNFTPYQLRHTAFTEVSLEFGFDYADAFVGHSLKGVGATYDHSLLQKQWSVVEKRQGCLAVQPEFKCIPTLRLFTGE